MAVKQLTNYIFATPIQCLVTIGLLSILVPILYFGALAVRRIYFHDLSAYPGPKKAAVTSLWYFRSHIRGTTPHDILAAHNEYGPIVRIAPEELSYEQYSSLRVYILLWCLTGLIHNKRDAAQVFSLGPRNCIGRNLAYLEMRLVIAKLVWHFDLKDSTSGNWRDQKIYMVWEKPPLMANLTPVKRRETA